MADTSNSNDGKLLARIDERTARMEKAQDERWDMTCERYDDHEARLRSLEHGWWRPIVAAIPGVGAIIAAVATGDS